MSANNQPSVLVWGACGFIGRSLVPALLARNARVSVVTRGKANYPSPRWENEVSWFELDGVNDRKILRDALTGVELVYNLAGASGAVASNRAPLESLDANCRKQLEFLEACDEAGTHPHVVFTSSRLVYGAVKHLPVDESCPTAPASMYAAHKLCVENYHQIYATAREAITYTICRISNPFGMESGATRKSYGVINSMIQNALENKPIPLFGDGSQVRDYLYIDDLVEALRLCGTHPAARNQVFNVGIGTGITMREAAYLIQSFAGGGEIVFQPWPADYSKVESGDYVADVRKLNHLVGFFPLYDLVAGLRVGIARQVALNTPTVETNPVSYAATGR